MANIDQNWTLFKLTVNQMGIASLGLFLSRHGPYSMYPYVSLWKTHGFCQLIRGLCPMQSLGPATGSLAPQAAEPVEAAWLFAGDHG